MHHPCRTLFFLAIAASASIAFAGRADNGTISGLAFGDYYYVVRSHDDALQGRNGFQFERIYFTYDKTLASEFSTRFRLEMNSPSLNVPKSTLAPFVKHAYLRWRDDGGHTSAYFGLCGTPTWGVIEEVWGYRPALKTPLDLHKMGSATDFGVAVQGSVGAGQSLTYHAMLGNGAGTSSETDKHKKAYLSLSSRPAKGLVLEAYGDFETGDDGEHRYVVQGFAGYDTDRTRLGVQLANQTRRKSDDGDDLNLTVGSVFGATEIVKGQVWALARVDRTFDPSPGGEDIAYTPFDERAAATSVLVGVDHALAEDVHVIPNILVTLYDSPASRPKPDSDVMPRLTVYYRF